MSRTDKRLNFGITDSAVELANHPALANLNICIKGAGDLATGVALRLFRSGMTKIVMLEVVAPLAVRRSVAFSEAVYLGEKIVEGLPAVRVDELDHVRAAWRAGRIPVMVDPDWTIIDEMPFHVVVDAVIAKHNLGTRLKDASLVIGLGPGFSAGQDVHRVVETNRGHGLGKVIRHGQAQANTGIPGAVMGYTRQRVLRAPQAGVFNTHLDIGDLVPKHHVIGQIQGVNINAQLGGVIRGLLRDGTSVERGTKLGDIDPRSDASLCNTVSDKARALGGGVLEAILEKYLVPGK